MAKINIPVRYRAGVSGIRHLDGAGVEEIKTALNGTGQQEKAELDTGISTPSQLAITPLPLVSNVEPAELKAIAEAVTALYGVRSAREMPIDEFVEEVCDALETIPEENLRLLHAERPQFREKLTSLLGVEIFTLVSKVRELTVEFERTFCHARIVTDIRPVFGSEVKDGPRAALVVHNLRLAYHKGNDRPQDFYVSLDGDDLQALRQLIDRAEAKARTLKASFAKDLPILGIPKEEI